jgi:HisJ family histidinol phosphate phosphatase
VSEDPRIAALPDIHGHAKGEHKPFAEERPIPYTARMLFLWFFHACRRGSPRFLMVADHMNYLTFEDPAAVNLVRRALKLAQAGDLYGAAETAGVELGHAAVVSEGLRKGMRYSIGAEIDNDPRCRPDAQNIVDAMKPDGTVRSVHFIPITHPQHGEAWMWAFDNPEFKDLYDVVGTEAMWEIYMATLLDAIDKLPGNIVGHFYVPAKFGHWPDDAVLETYEDRFVDACAERGMAIEINSRYLYKYFVDDEANAAKFRAVHLRLMHKAKEKGVAIAVGSDAHSPKDQGGAFEQILAMLDEADINEIAFPIGGRLARVALRATEEILRQHTAALAPPPLPIPVHVEEREDDDNDAPETAPEPEAGIPVAVAPRRKKPTPKLVTEPAAATVAPPEHQAPTIVETIVEAAGDLVAAVVNAVTPKKPRAKKPSPTATTAHAELPYTTPPHPPADVPVPEQLPVPVRVSKKPAAEKPSAKPAAQKPNPAPSFKAPPTEKHVAPTPKKTTALAPPKPAAKPLVPKPTAKPSPKPAPKPTPAKPAAKAATKKAPTKPIAAKKPAKKAAPPPKKAAAKKPKPTKSAPKRPAPKKAAPKPAPKKPSKSKPISKPAAKKSAPPKKAAPKKPASKKSVPKRPATKKKKDTKRRR